MGWLQDIWTKRTNSDWTLRVNQKISETSENIRIEWLLSDSQLAEACLRTDLTGDFIMTFLGEQDAEITKIPAPELAKRIRQRERTAKETTLAFCHRAAVAHQIVSNAGQ